MVKLPKKFVDRVGATWKQYRRATIAQQVFDVAEVDTVTLVDDILNEISAHEEY